LSRSGAGARFTALDLSPAPSCRQIRGSLLLSSVADFNVVIHGDRAGRLGQARGGAFVLHHIRLALDSRYAALYLEAELVGANFRFNELEPDDGLNLRVRRADGSGWRGRALMDRGRVLLRGEREEYRKQRKRRGE